MKNHLNAGVAYTVQEPPRLPPWWRGGEEDYRRAHAARAEIYSHDRIMARKACTTLAAAALAAAAMYGVDALGLVSGSSSGVLPVAAAFLLAATGIWLLDRRLEQQFRDAKLHAFLWSELVAAIRRGRVDLEGIQLRPPFETEVEALLRRQLLIVSEFLATSEYVALHLPLLDPGVVLTRMDTARRARRSLPVPG